MGYCLIGVILHWTGQDAEAGRTLADALELLRAGMNELGAAYALGYLALIEVEHGALDRAEELAMEALQEGDDPGFSEHFVLTIAHLARVPRATLLHDGDRLPLLRSQKTVPACQILSRNNRTSHRAHR